MSPAVRRPWSAVLVTVVVFAVTCAGCGSSARRQADPASPNPYGLPQTTVTGSEDDCGRGWSHPRAGAQVLQLRNAGSVVTDAYLVNARTGAVYEEAEGIGVGAVQPLQVTLGGGSYAIECLPEDLDVVKGPTVRVPGGAVRGSTPAVVPADVHQLIPPTLAYQKWVQGRLDELVARTDALRSAIERGDLAGARAAWLPAHLGYEELSGAKLAFADADAAINGTTAGLPGGLHDPGFTGFHRIEYGLWHGEPARSLRPLADRLATDVSDLRESWPRLEMDPLYLSQRGHEIMESAAADVRVLRDYARQRGLIPPRRSLRSSGPGPAAPKGRTAATSPDGDARTGLTMVGEGAGRLDVRLPTGPAR